MPPAGSVEPAPTVAVLDDDDDTEACLVVAEVLDVLSGTSLFVDRLVVVAAAAAAAEVLLRVDREDVPDVLPPGVLVATVVDVSDVLGSFLDISEFSKKKNYTKKSIRYSLLLRLICIYSHLI
jgi:hypothetical protein